MKIRDILRNKGSDVLTVNMRKTVHEAIKILFKNKIGALVVLDDREGLVGIISERDVLWECVDRGDLLRKTLIEQVMTHNLIIATPDDDTNHALAIMTKHKIRHLPVVEKQKMIGIVSIGDLVKSGLSETDVAAQYMTDMVSK